MIMSCVLYVTSGIGLVVKERIENQSKNDINCRLKKMSIIYRGIALYKVLMHIKQPKTNSVGPLMAFQSAWRHGSKVSHGHFSISFFFCTSRDVTLCTATQSLIEKKRIIEVWVDWAFNACFLSYC
jgi:hypothetical protein